VRAARAVKNSVSDAAELWIAPNKQFCLKPSLECRQRWRRTDISRQTVPHASRGLSKSLCIRRLKARVTRCRNSYHNMCLPGSVKIRPIVLEKSRRNGFLRPTAVPCDIAFHHLTAKVDLFTLLLRRPSVIFCSKIVHSLSKHHVHKSDTRHYERMHRLTDQEMHVSSDIHLVADLKHELS